MQDIEGQQKKRDDKNGGQILSLGSTVAVLLDSIFGWIN